MERFRTKGGGVRVTDDELRVESGPLVQARRYWRGNRVLFAFTYAVGPALLVQLGVDLLRDGEWATVFGGPGLAIGGFLVLWGYYRLYLGFSTDDRIPLAAVERAAVDEEWGNPRLVVEYRSGDRRRRRRLLLASPRFADGVGEFETAVEILRRRGIPIERGS